jgi:hypothetical protein
MASRAALPSAASIVVDYQHRSRQPVWLAPLQHGRQPLRFHRLLQELGGAQQAGSPAVVGNREQDDGDRRQNRIGLQLAQNRPAVDARHKHIQGDGRRPYLFSF